MHDTPDLHSNLGLATDLLLHAQEGTVEPHGDYVVVRTDDAPDYFFGNMLVLQKRPHEADLSHIESDFASLVGAPPRIAHRTFIWAERWPPDPESVDDEALKLDAFAAHGYDAMLCRVLVAEWSDVRAVETNPSVQVRRLTSQIDWDTWTRMHFDDMPRGHEDSSRRYLAHKQRAYRRMIERGLGDWWGAFIDGEQVGSLGLFFVGGIARFQSVLTDERYRNRKVCRTLVSETIRIAKATAQGEQRASQLVMVADEDYHAGRIYEALGFRAQGRLASLCRMPELDIEPAPQRDENAQPAGMSNANPT
ncbi:GNAT family N-acetyltransferase [Paraburkholderia phosphatilytica]|uniref:GNAT family N-acetyltransferase n=1 Tax=Paraburkholderia phosphatilytica TaxID=2282883 RepID=UPI00197D8BE1|nr:GNAT family N-acetyltransferase [Paraburkholderia phosphatilytica]